MNHDFYDKCFDDATQLKLEIFRRYLREWLPVFMTHRKGGRSRVSKVNIYDFFAGPGRDSAGNPGSPLIIVDEMRKYCAAHADLKAKITVKMVFNDIVEEYIHDLGKSVAETSCEQACCQIEYSALSFSEALANQLSEMKDPSSANLVIMDQFGVKEVTPEIVQRLAHCGATDILFFISTSFIKRFIETPGIGGKYDLSVDEMKNKEYNFIHRYICEYYRERLGGTSYYLAPFSVKKGSNIYGVVFGAGHLLGLEKFLKVCWSLDPMTGEANYNIDGDFSWGGQVSLFEDLNRVRKVDLFERDLRDYIAACRPDNISLNEFCLTKGFPPFKAREVLRAMQAKRKLSVWDLQKRKAARKGAFYLGWGTCKTNIARVRFSVEAAS